jgi:hypothetical protein
VDTPPSALAETAPEKEGAAGKILEPPRPGLQRGEAIGRYLVLETLGEGGIGTVLAAYDPQLDRRVALKILRRETKSRPSNMGMRERVLREARALARVVHPNIVAVHDAGFHGDELYVVMELIDGVTLRRWLEDAPRTRTEILGVFAQAGRGLQAAHTAGLVHRDFKPDNVLVGKDGRVRVADFGLARVLDAGHTPTPPPLGETPPAPQLVTQTGALVGTPAYMAPEQWAREKVDARADQFAFAVALHEALYGVRPFPGETYARLGRAVTGGRLREPPPGKDVPAWLRAILLRALATDPEARFPAMAPLVAALGSDPAAARRRRLGLAALTVAAVGTAALAVLLLRRDAPSLCHSGDAELAAVWGASARLRLESAFGATGRPYAADTFARVARRLDRRPTCTAHSRARRSTFACAASIDGSPSWARSSTCSAATSTPTCSSARPPWPASSPPSRPAPTSRLSAPWCRRPPTPWCAPAATRSACGSRRRARGPRRRR